MVAVELLPNTYSIRLSGASNSTFYINLPSSVDGQTVNASDYIIEAIPSVNFNADTATSASFAKQAMSASYAPSSGGGNSVSSSYAATASYVKIAQSSSYATWALSVVTSSFSLNSKSASYAQDALSASYAPNMGGGGTFDTTQISADIRNPSGTLTLNQVEESNLGNGIQIVADNGDKNNSIIGGQVVIQGGVDINDIGLSTPNKIVVSGKAGADSGMEDNGINIVAGNGANTGNGSNGAMINIIAGNGATDYNTGGNVNIQAGNGTAGNGTINLLGNVVINNQGGYTNVINGYINCGTEDSYGMTFNKGTSIYGWGNTIVVANQSLEMELTAPTIKVNGGAKLYDYSSISSPVEGMIAWDYSNHVMKVYDGSQWN